MNALDLVRAAAEATPHKLGLWTMLKHLHARTGGKPLSIRAGAHTGSVRIDGVDVTVRIDNSDDKTVMWAADNSHQPGSSRSTSPLLKAHMNRRRNVLVLWQDQLPQEPTAFLHKLVAESVKIVDRVAVAATEPQEHDNVTKLGLSLLPANPKAKQQILAHGYDFRLRGHNASSPVQRIHVYADKHAEPASLVHNRRWTRFELEQAQAPYYWLRGPVGEAILRVDANDPATTILRLVVDACLKYMHAVPATAAAEPGTIRSLDHFWDELTRRGSFKSGVGGDVVEAKLEHRTTALRGVIPGKQRPAYNVSVIAAGVISSFRVFYRASEDVVEIDGTDNNYVLADHITDVTSVSDLVKQIATKCHKLAQVLK